MSLEFSPYYLKRIANKGSRFKNDLDDISKLESKAKSVEINLKKEKEKVDNYLFNKIKQINDKSKRTFYLKLKRDIYNDRFKKVKQVLPLLSLKDKDYIESTIALYKKRRNLIEQMYTTWDNQLETNRSILQRDLKGNKDFLNAILMSNDKIFNNTQRYKDLDIKNEKPNKKEHHTELSLKNFHNRMTKKPSPFSTFVEVELYAKSLSKYHPKEHSYFKSQSRLNELVVKIIEQELLKDKKLLEKKYISINPTIYKFDDNTYKAIAVDLSEPGYLYYGERLIKLKLNNIIKSIIYSLIDNKCISFSDIISSLKEEFSLEPKISYEILEKMASMGILYNHFNISDQSLNLEKLVEILRGDIKYKSLKRELEELIILLYKINKEDTTTKEKREIISSIYQSTTDIFHLLDLDIQKLNIQKKNVIYENNISPYISEFKTTDLLSEKDNVFSAVKLLRLFDDNLIEKIGMRIHFLDKYKIGDNPNLVEFFESYSKISEEELWGKIKIDSTVKLIKELRINFLEHLKDWIEEEPYRESILISNAWIDDFLKRSPAILSKWKSFSVYIQKQKDDLILNNVGPGYGRHFLRYSTDLSKDSQQHIKELYSKHISDMETTHKRKLIDIGTTLGLNINLHPNALKKEIVYPGAVSEEETNAIYPNQMYISFNEKTNSIEPFLKDEKGIILETTPLGFLFPMLAPSFYKYLCAFSYSNGVEVSMWDRYEILVQGEKYSKKARYPNIYIGNVLLERETWKIDSSEIDSFVKSNDNVNSYLSLRKTLKSLDFKGMEFFAKFSKDIDALISEDMSPKDWIKEVSNTQHRKPQYYNCNNGLDLMNFKRTLNNLKSRVSLQSLYPNHSSVEEYLFELNEV